MIINKEVITLFFVCFWIEWNGISAALELSQNFEYETTDRVTIWCAMNSSGQDKIVESQFISHKQRPTRIINTLIAEKPDKIVIFYDAITKSPDTYENSKSEHYKNTFAWIKREPRVIVCYFIYRSNNPSTSFVKVPPNGRFEFVVRLGFSLVKLSFWGRYEEISSKVIFMGYSLGGNVALQVSMQLATQLKCKPPAMFIWDVSSMWTFLRDSDSLAANMRQPIMAVHCANEELTYISPFSYPKIADVFIINVDHQTYHVPAILHWITSSGQYKICLSPGFKGPGNVINIATDGNKSCKYDEIEYGIHGWTRKTRINGVYSLDVRKHKSIQDLLKVIPDDYKKSAE